MKLPSLQFYPGDWRKDPGVQALSYHDRGVWFEILCLMHESPQRGKLLLNGQPMPDTALARLLGLDKQNLTTTLTNLLEFGVTSRDDETGALVSRRMVRDEEIRKIRSAAGKLGGNPALLKQNGTSGVKQKSTTRDKRKPTPSSSSSSSTSVDTPLPPFEEIEVKPLCSLEQARSQAPVARMSLRAVEFWWHSRNASGWRKGGAGNPRIVSWQSDMASSRQWAEDAAAKDANSTPGGKPAPKL